MIHNEGGYMIRGENSEYCQRQNETTLIQLFDYTAHVFGHFLTQDVEQTTMSFIRAGFFGVGTIAIHALRTCNVLVYNDNLLLRNFACVSCKAFFDLQEQEYYQLTV